MQKSLLSCQTVWIVFVRCVFPWLFCVNYKYSSGEGFSTREWSACTCLAPLLEYCPSRLPDRKQGSGEGAGPGEDAHGLLGRSGRHWSLSSDLLAYRKHTGSKITCSHGLSTLPLCPGKKVWPMQCSAMETKITLVGWAGNTWDSWNCHFRRIKREFLMYLQCAIFFFLFLFFL